MSLSKTTIVHWLYKLLKTRFTNCQLLVEDTSGTKLSSWLLAKNLISRIPRAEFFDFKVDITAAIIDQKSLKLYLMESKSQSISIKDVTQMWGFCRIVQPYRAAIVSPSGVSENLFRLIMVSGRTDVFRYNNERKNNSVIRICKWDIGRSDMDFSSSIPLGFHP